MSFRPVRLIKALTWLLGTKRLCGEALRCGCGGFLFFAENLFGDQFALRDNRVWLFDPETGVAELFADTLAGWASRILQDPEAVGFATALAWQQAYGDIPPGKRLFCKIPFVLGGQWTLPTCILETRLMPCDGGRIWRDNCVGCLQVLQFVS